MMEELCLSQIRGQQQVKRALEIAASGGLNVLMIGPPGSGKTLLARRLPTILPDIEQVRPFRAPHHTVSALGLKGEVTLAHNGVLFLDELPEFRPNTLKTLYIPPNSVQLVAAMNPCPCGYHGTNHRQCICTPNQIQCYYARIPRAFWDNIDIYVLIDPKPDRDCGETSAVIKQRVTNVHAIRARLISYAYDLVSVREERAVAAEEKLVWILPSLSVDFFSCPHGIEKD